MLLYLLLFGRPPFCEETKEGTMNSIKRAHVDFSRNNYGSIPIDSNWSSISSEAKDLIGLFLTKNPMNRITAETAMRHVWFKKFPKHKMKNMDQEKNLVHTLMNLKNFKAQTTLQKAVLVYVASQLLDPKQEQELRDIFNTMNKNKNGEVTEQELYKYYFRIYNSKAQAKRDSTLVMRRADINNNGVIDYNEFLMANMAYKKALSEEALKRAFEFYDSDNNGYISPEELRRVFGNLCNEEELKQMMHEADLNGDNQLSFDEFKRMMTGFKSQTVMLKHSWTLP